jgi:chemotaxis protein MotB
MSVTQELIKNGVEPNRLTAAGRGEHAPKASNNDEKGKAINRRTEIILEPKLDEIMGILNK